MAAAAATAVTKGNGGGGARAGAGEASGSRKKKGPGPLATAYLVIYNVVMTAGWLVIAVGLVRAYLAKGSYHSLYYSIEKPLKFFQTGALLEILHCAVENLQAFTEFVPGDKHCAKHREYKYQQTAPCSQAKDTNMKPSVTKVLPKGLCASGIQKQLSREVLAQPLVVVVRCQPGRQSAEDWTGAEGCASEITHSHGYWQGTSVPHHLVLST
ncbi:very-long-chain (3R)-3-hydroxyacyl-CoA dehydratase 2 isoform X2 [Neophocaena asiaeorientalis asiaeorientalis]|uniref:very-long-chain (3R)-3-hydroxyacyl-CoA dehydratase n=1 Tax=Neophocaena asiaeorientalis asiaeorientalis TaxID=1706337 RepID=A0A341CBY2_NEOAA|nr:very-long-chain (3R)-3-hydroxyacyl-CoA dehydratase 2 isoform X2 [Neophocaena asiaeorientalis asiaeorientalis]